MSRLGEARWGARRVRQVGWGRMMLLGKTFALLMAAKVALRWVPVGRVMGWKQRPVRGGRAGEARLDAELAGWAVEVVCRYSPVAFVCFPQCLAASELLRGWGVASRLHYGVARSEGKLVTHTWLEASGAMVVGGDGAEEYSELAVY